jgi:hypothetical protein
MTQRIKSLGYKAAATTALALSYTGVASAATAADCDPANSSNIIASGAACAAPTGAADNLFVAGGIFQQISNTLIFLVGAIAVIMLIIGGLRYVTSNGEAASIKGAKDTITYAIIGIIVAILSFALVSFVIGRFTTV